MSWFYLALLAPLLYAVANLLDDNLLSFVYESPVVATAVAGFFGALPIFSRLFIHANALNTKLALFAEAAGFMTVLYLYFYFRALQTEVPSVVVALFSLVPASVPFLAYFLVHERLNGSDVVGLILVLVATFWLASTGIRRFKFSAALAPVLLAVLLVDASTILIKYVYQRATFYQGFLYSSIGMGLGCLFFFTANYRSNISFLRSIKPRLRKLLPVFIATELIALGAELTLNLAISRGPVSLVKVIESTQPLYVLLIAVLFYPLAPRFFREAKQGMVIIKLSLMILAIAGIAVIGIGGHL